MKWCLLNWLIDIVKPYWERIVIVDIVHHKAILSGRHTFLNGVLWNIFSVDEDWWILFVILWRGELGIRSFELLIAVVAGRILAAAWSVISWQDHLVKGLLIYQSRNRSLQFSTATDLTLIELGELAGRWLISSATWAAHIWFLLRSSQLRVSSLTPFSDFPVILAWAHVLLGCLDSTWVQIGFAVKILHLFSSCALLFSILVPFWLLFALVVIFVQ